MKRVKHFALALAALFTLGASAMSFAVPVKPDLDKILRQQEQRNRQFEPAQAGWNGPEMPRPQDAAPNVVLETYGPAATARAVRASLATAAVPDPKAVIAIGLLIVLMRIMRQAQERQKRSATVVAMRPIAAARGEERRAA
jgi:hypothetical protein